MRQPVRHAVCALIAGALLSGAFEPVAAGWLVPLAVGTLAYLVHGLRVREAAAVGYLFGLGFLGPLLFWLAHSITPAAWLALSLVAALWPAITGVLMSLALRVPGGPLWAAAAWSAVELARQEVPLGGFPWGRAGFAAIDTVWAGLLPYVGVTGTGFALAMIGTFGAHAARSRTGGALTGLVGVAMLSVIPVVAPYAVTASGSVTVAAVQPGVPGQGNDVLAHHRQITRRLLEATTQLADDVAHGTAARPDLVVWPESSTAADPLADPEARGIISRAAAATAAFGAPLLVGALVGVQDEKRVVNQGIVWTAEGPTGDRFTKHHPVPFGEYIPLRPLLGGVSDRLDAIPRDMLAGSGSLPWQVGDLPVAGAICFDVAFDDVIVPQVRNGAELVIVQTSNATFIDTPQLEQQFAITRARATESGRSTVVASVNGITALIGPDGQTVRRASPKGTAVMVDRLATSTTLTPAVRLERSVTGVVLMAGMTGPVWALMRGRARRAHSGSGRRDPVAWFSCCRRSL